MPPGSYTELAEMLRERLPKLTGGQRRIAHLLLADPEGTAVRGISEAARLAEVNESSIARFANSVGLPGYPALKELCKVWLAEQAQLARRGSNGKRPASGLLSETLEQEQTNLSRTFGRLDMAAWLKAVGVLTEASLVHVIGLRDCAAVAALLASRLNRMRSGVRRLHSPVVDELREFAGGQALVAISVRRYAAETVRVAEFARERGAEVIALTDNGASPLAQFADAALFAETTGVGKSRSLTALFSLAQALAAEVALRVGDPGPDDQPPGFGFFHE